LKRRRSELTFTLFPFLAVLMCTMGALILILLVTTRQIRRDAVAAAIQQQHEPEQIAAASAKPTPVSQPDEPVILANIAPPAFLPWPLSRPTSPALPAEPVEAAIPLPPQSRGPDPQQLAREAYERELATRLAAQRQLDAELQAQLTQLANQLAELDAREQAQQAQVQVAQQQLGELQGKLAEARRQRESSADSVASAAAELSRKREEYRTAQKALTELQQQLESTAAAKQQQRAQLAIVARDPQAGTTRRPILIEVQADRLNFPGEQISLTTQEVNGFTPQQNPVRAITAALLEYWTAVDRAAGRDEPEPYVLVLVRPQGIVGFLVVCQMLKDLKTPSGEDIRFGYELILAEDEFSWPQTDPQAVALCRDALRRSLSERPAIVERPRNNSRHPLDDAQFVAADGTFRLAEVDRMRQVQDPYSISNPWVSPHGEAARRRAAQQTANSSTGTSRDRQHVWANPPGNAGSSAVPPAPVSTSEAAAEIGGQRSGQVGGGSGSGATSSTGTGERRLSTEDYFEKALREARQSGATSRSGSSSPGGDAGAGSGLPTGSPASALGGLDLVNRSPAGGGGTSGGTGLGESSPSDPLAAFNAGAPGGGGGSGGNANGPREPNWLAGQKTASRAIGIEREVVLEVYLDRLVLPESGLEQPLPEYLDRLQFQRLLAHLLSEDVAGWGPPPAGFSWRPFLKVNVHPGANLHAGRIDELARQWGVKLRLENVLE
jgi:hypothetical protein